MMLNWQRLLAGVFTLSLIPGQSFAQTSQPTTASSRTLPPTSLPTGYTGSSDCRDCHQPFYEKWASSRHGLAMQPFTADFANKQLKPHPEAMVIRDVRYRADINGDKSVILENGPAGERKYPMQHVLGGKNVFYFLTPLDRGRLQVLPLAYDVRRQEWFDTTASAARGIMNIQDEILDWRAPQLTFNTSCYSCHVSQLSTNYDPQKDAYHTVWAEPGINCEACHAAGGEHVRLFRNLKNGEVPKDIRIISTKKFTVEQTNTLCAPCHAKAMPLTNTFRPGDRFFDNYDLVTPEQPDFYPDGRDLGENYTYTSWRMSPCAKSGKLSCLHCHTSSGRYRFTENPNEACLPCHEKNVKDSTAHTRHKPESEGNKCVACHMPMTEFARMRRSDHSMRPPTPATTIAFKSPNACNLCHTDKDASWSDKNVREWHKNDYQAPILRVAGLLDAARKADWSRLPEILTYLTQADRDEIFTVAFIRQLHSCEDERQWPVLIQALKDSSPLVRASAAEVMDDHPAPEVIEALLTATRDDYRLVRVRAAAALAAVPREQLKETARRDLERATTEMEAILRARPDDSASHYNLGNFYMARRDMDRAVASFERAVYLQPDSIVPLVNASIAHNLAGRNTQAEDCLRRALKIAPTNAAANLNLGLLLGEQGRLDEAAVAFQAAFKSDPRSATAAYNLAVILASQRPAEAIEWCRKACALRPDEPKYVYTLAFYLKQSGNNEEAIAALRSLTDRDIAFPDAYALLGRIYEELRRTEEAVNLYRRAADNPKLPELMRRSLGSRARMLDSAVRP